MSNFNELSIITRIKALIKSRNWNVYMLATKSHMSYSALYQILKKPHIPTIYTLNKICAAFDISISEFFAYCDDSRQTDFLQLWNMLDNTSKDYVITYMKGLTHSPMKEDENENL